MRKGRPGGLRGAPGRGPLGARFITRPYDKLRCVTKKALFLKGFQPLPDFQGIRMPPFRGPFRASPGAPPGGSEGDKSLKSPKITKFREIH